jgi:hypothetical protein
VHTLRLALESSSFRTGTVHTALSWAASILANKRGVQGSVTFLSRLLLGYFLALLVFLIALIHRYTAGLTLPRHHRWEPPSHSPVHWGRHTQVWICGGVRERSNLKSTHLLLTFARYLAQAFLGIHSRAFLYPQRSPICSSVCYPKNSHWYSTSSTPHHYYTLLSLTPQQI